MWGSWFIKERDGIEGHIYRPYIIYIVYHMNIYLLKGDHLNAYS